MSGSIRQRAEGIIKRSPCFYVAECEQEPCVKGSSRACNGCLNRWAADDTITDLNSAERGSRTSKFEKWNLNQEHIVLYDPLPAASGSGGAQTTRDTP